MAPKKSKAKPILLGCGGVTLLMLLGIGACAFVARDSIGGVFDIGRATVAAEEFMTDLDAERYAAASGQATNAGGCQGADQVATAQADDLGARLSGYSIEIGDESFSEDLENVDEVEFFGTATIDGEQQLITLELVDEGGWQVCSFSITQ